MDIAKIQKDFLARVKKYQAADVKVLKSFKIEKSLVLIHKTGKNAGFVAKLLAGCLGKMGYKLDTQYRNLKQ